MDLLQTINHGIQRSGVMQRVHGQDNHHERERARLVSKARALWRNALLVDQTAGLMSMFEQQAGVLRGLSTILGAVALAIAIDHDAQHPNVRLIRGALSAVQQAHDAGATITPDLARALGVACAAAREAIDTLSDNAVEQGAHYLHQLASIPMKGGR